MSSRDIEEPVCGVLFVIIVIAVFFRAIGVF